MEIYNRPKFAFYLCNVQSASYYIVLPCLVSGQRKSGTDDGVRIDGEGNQGILTAGGLFFSIDYMHAVMSLMLFHQLIVLHTLFVVVIVTIRPHPSHHNHAR